MKEKNNFDNKTVALSSAIIVTLFLMVMILTISIVNYGQLIDKTDVEKNSEFKCDPYYNGKRFSETCNVLFINKTGNYCDGILVCENERKIK
jgi:hypothetical protein